MLGKKIKLFTLFGFDVQADMSWLVIAVLVTWSLSRQAFPLSYRGYASSTYWLMGAGGALGLFASIVFHEISHSLVARKFGLPIRDITLFIFGGVAQMEEEPPSPKAEFYMAIAGPIASIILGLVLLGLDALGFLWNWPVTILGVIHYLWPLNFILAAFNILPAFPLDGGRVLRAALWKWRGNIHWATRIASRIGSMFGFILIFIGIYFVIRGPFITGIWWILIGFFLHNASQMSYRRLLMARALQGEPVRRFMQEEVITVEPTVTVRSLVEDFIYRYHYKMFPVVRDEILIGCITTREVKEIPREQWDRQLIGEALQPCSKENTISVNEDATKALAVMHQSGNSRLMVTDDGRLVGIIALKDLLQFLSLKMELEPEALDL